MVGAHDEMQIEMIEIKRDEIGDRFRFKRI